jgi:hypothetical protein
LLCYIAFQPEWGRYNLTNKKNLKGDLLDDGLALMICGFLESKTFRINFQADWVNPPLK